MNRRKCENSFRLLIWMSDYVLTSAPKPYVGGTGIVTAT